MADHNIFDEIKHKIRRLKKLELLIRFGEFEPAKKPPAAKLVWDSFFELHANSVRVARFTIQQLSVMSAEEYRAVLDEFFYRVYDKFYSENRFKDMQHYDPDILLKLGLPYYADAAAIKKRFHELALQVHPDTGGDAAKFIELMKNYRKLIEKGK